MALLALVVYNLNLRVIPSGDTRANRYMPLALWRDGRLTLERFEPQVTGGSPLQYWVVRLADGRLVSQYSPVTPLLVAPLYLPAVLR